MADYWKSQDRKFCDFCKCWIADNKPSIQFHENGKRHKENVAKRISEISKKSAKQHKESVKLDAEMKKMEEAAMRAYMNDIETNPDFTSQQILEQLHERGQNLNDLKASIPKAPAPAPPQPKKPKKEKKKDKNAHKAPPLPPPKKKIWYEAQTNEGHKYYWNDQDQESVWIPPAEFVSIEQQKRQAEFQKQQAELQAKLIEEMQAAEMTPEKMEEIRSAKAREEMRKFAKVEPVEPRSEISGPILGPETKVDPYGKWTTVKKVERKPINLQLPKVEYIEIKVPAVYEPKVKIKEKKIESLDGIGDDSSVPTFKKRKPNPNRMNMRRKMDDDDD